MPFIGKFPDVLCHRIYNFDRRAKSKISLGARHSGLYIRQGSISVLVLNNLVEPKNRFKRYMYQLLENHPYNASVETSVARLE